MIQCRQKRILGGVRRLLILLILGCIGFAQTGWAACADWPKIMANQTLTRLPKQAILIAAEPFQDDTKTPGDDWLEHGIANLLMQYLATPSDVTTLPESLVAKLPTRHKPKFRIGGKFQHLQNTFRAFVFLKDGKGRLLAQYPMQVPYPYNKQFFVEFKKIAEQVLQKVGSIDINADKLRLIQNATDNVRSFENASRGRTLFFSFDPDSMEAALVWFQEAKSQDLRYREAYIGAADVYAFLALDHKQNRQPFGVDIQNAEGALKERDRFVKKSTDLLQTMSLGARVINAHVYFVTALHAAEQKRWGEAAAAMEEVLRLTPEDGIAYSHLATIYDRLGGGTKARAMRKKAQELNSCL